MEPVHNVPSTVKCPDCGGVLGNTGLKPEDVARCSLCGCEFSLHDPKSSRNDRPVARSRLAVLSLVLGVTSMLCLFVTGIPAILAGTAALRRIRRDPERITGRGFAWGGIITGSLFGVLCGGSFVGLTIVAAARAMPNRDPVIVRQAMDAIGKIEIPPPFTPEAVSKPFFGMQLVFFKASRDDGAYGEIAVHQYSASLGPPLQHRGSLEVNHALHIDRSERSTITVLGRPTEMIQQAGHGRDGSAVRRYLTAFRAGEHSVILVVGISTPAEPAADKNSAPGESPGTLGPILTDDQVRTMFESFRLP